MNELLPDVGSAGATDRLTELLDKAYESHLASDPYDAVVVAGQESEFADRISNARYPFTLDGARRNELRRSGETLVKELGHVVATGSLTAHEQLTAAQTTAGVQLRLDLMNNTDPLRPIDHTTLTPLVACLADFAGEGRKLESEQDFVDSLTQAAGLFTWIHTAIKAMEDGKRVGDVQPAAVIEATIVQLRSLLDSGRLRELCMAPLLRAEAWIPRRLAKTYQKAMERYLLDGYECMVVYLRDDYLPHCRGNGKPGLFYLPNGRKQHERTLAYWSAEDAFADELYGQAEARFLQTEQSLQKIARQKGLTLKGLMRYLQHPTFRTYDSPKQLHEQFEQRLDILWGHLPKLFHERDIPLDRCRTYLNTADDATAAYVLPKGGQPGYVSLSGARPEAYSTNSLLRLAAHEGIPGHHLQLSQQRNAEHIHPYLRHLTPIPAFREGWALYAESLIPEMGIEQTELERASLLVTQLSIARGVMLDVMLHSYGYSIDEAKSSRREMHGYDSEEVALADILRFVAWPGQVVAYMRDLAFSEYRAYAERALGPAFDIRDFHSMILTGGEMTMDILGARVGRWVLSQQGRMH